MTTSNLSSKQTLTPIFINPVGLYDPRPNTYSHVAIADRPARLIYIAGQGGETANGDLSPNFDMQVHQALCNLRIALGAANADVKVVKLTLLIVDHSQERLAIVGRQLQEIWGEPLAP